ncbi:MAG: hypothetical protein EP349_02835 [Alphaproteobacteria bacterium]|nr:MAG: hypothetical protein EP349_02835 [Alphaproteobacteria bacterium]
MFDPKQLSEMVNNLFSKEEQEQIAALQEKSFDEQMDGFAAIVQANQKIPEGQKQAFVAICSDADIRADMKEIQAAANDGGIKGKMTMAKKMPGLMMKVQRKMRGQ